MLRDMKVEVPEISAVPKPTGDQKHGLANNDPCDH